MSVEIHEPPMIDTKRAADILGIDRDTVKRFIADGRIPATRDVGGRRWLIDEAWLVAWKPQYERERHESMSAGGRRGYERGLAKRRENADT